MESSKDDVTCLRTITIHVDKFLCIFVKDDKNNQITSVCLSLQKGVVSSVIENFKMFGPSCKLVLRIM